jgi:hypothetical protein
MRDGIQSLRNQLASPKPPDDEQTATKPAKVKVDKEDKIQGQVDANAAAILRAHDEGKSVKELYKMFGIDKGLFCDLVYIVLFRAGRLPKSKYAERVAAKHPVTLDKRFIHPRPERKEE